MNVVWKDIPGFAEYQVSSNGLIRSLKNGRVHMMRRANHPGGYLQVNLRCKGRYKMLYVHRAVALAFLPNPSGYMDVNHKNCEKKDNRLENLEWCSRSQNQIHAIRAGIHDDRLRHQKEHWQGEGHPRATLTNEQVRAMRADHKSGVKPKQLVAKYGTTLSRVEHVIYGSAWRGV